MSEEYLLKRLQRASLSYMFVMKYQSGFLRLLKGMYYHLMWMHLDRRMMSKVKLVQMNVVLQQSYSLTGGMLESSHLGLPNEVVHSVQLHAQTILHLRTLVVSTSKQFAYPRV